MAVHDRGDGFPQGTVSARRMTPTPPRGAPLEIPGVELPVFILSSVHACMHVLVSADT